MNFLRRYRALCLSFVIFAALLAAFTFVLHQQNSRSLAQEHEVIRRYETIRQARLVITHLLNMETGTRGYLLSGNKDFLNPYELGIERVDDAYVKLHALTEDEDAETRQDIAQLGSRIDDVKVLLAGQIKRYKAAHGAQFPITLNDMWAGKDAMDKARQLVDNFLAGQAINLETSIASWHLVEQRYIWVLTIGALVFLLSLLATHYAMIGVGNRAALKADQLKDLEESYRLLLAGMNDGTYDYHPATGYMYLSPSHERLLGYTPSELPNRIETMNNLLHPDDYAKAWETADKYMRRETSEFSSTYRVLHKNGDWCWILSRGVGVWDEDTGALRRLVGIHTDITPQKRREAELSELNEELESFTYIASHDLRGPLINIKGFAGEVDYALRHIQPQLDRMTASLTGTELTDVQQALNVDVPESLGFIRAAVDKMDKLTSAILDLSRLGRREYKSEPVDSNTVVQNCLKALAYEIGQKGITVECHNLPQVTTDEVALEQVFGNMIDNAVKYMPAGKSGKITVTCEMTPTEYSFTVADNGSGIGELDRKKVFDIFRRGNNAKGERGIGMGMAYVKTTLRKLGGRVWFDSVLGEGTNFHFTLPHDIMRQPAA